MGKNILCYIRLLSLSLAVFCYYFQVPFEGVAPFITVFMALFLLSNIKSIVNVGIQNSIVILLYIGIIIFLLCSFVWSVYCGTTVNNAVRFLTILIAIPLCFFCKVGYADKIYKIFILLSICKSIMLIILAAMLIADGDHTVLRLWAETNGYGDIYLDGEFVPKVQIQGNGLLAVAFMISFCKRKRFNLVNLIILAGVIAAGNFAFKLGLVMFFFWIAMKNIDYKMISLKKILAVTLLFCMSVFFIQYAMVEMEKKAGYGASNTIRLSQYEALIDTNVLIGSGIGAPVKDVGASRGGRVELQYYEMQTLYIFYQVGAVCLISYYILLFLLMKMMYMRDARWLFAIYLFYAFFNPYCFDTTEMIVISLLGILYPKNAYNTVCFAS